MLFQIYFNQSIAAVSLYGEVKNGIRVKETNDPGLFSSAVATQAKTID
ncbi:hypothetical protein [Terrimonas alba]